MLMYYVYWKVYDIHDLHDLLLSLYQIISLESLGAGAVLVTWPGNLAVFFMVKKIRTSLWLKHGLVKILVIAEFVIFATWTFFSYGRRGRTTPTLYRNSGYQARLKI